MRIRHGPATVTGEYTSRHATARRAGRRRERRSGSQDTGLSRARSEERGLPRRLYVYNGTSRPPLFTPARRRHARRATAVAVALSAALLTVGCGSSQDTTEDAKATAASSAGFPVTVDNCGVKTTYDKPPSRVVTIHQHPAELMLALGLKNRMVGTAFPDSAVLPELRTTSIRFRNWRRRNRPSRPSWRPSRTSSTAVTAAPSPRTKAAPARRSPTPASTPTSTANTAARSGSRWRTPTTRSAPSARSSASPTGRTSWCQARRHRSTRPRRP